jgi:hypothetical protein
VKYLGCDGPDEKSFQRAVSVRRHHNQVNAFVRNSAQDLVGRIALEHHALNGRGLEFWPYAPLQLFLRVRHSLLDQFIRSGATGYEVNGLTT